MSLAVRLLGGIGEIAAEQWDCLCDSDNPFIRHAFLSALENHGSVSPYSGWYPRHLTLFDGERLVGAAPMYLKSHSYGEFVFDFSWSQAHKSRGLEYYPKLLVAAPLTPAVGPRLLAASGEDVRGRLAAAIIESCDRDELSSAHINFVTETDARFLRTAGFLERHDWQFHWHNRGYRDFNDFLSNLTSKKRKNIRQERAGLRRKGWAFERINGRDAGEWHWLFMHGLYRSTFERKGNWPLLTQAVFRELGRRMGERITLVLARQGDKYAAGAFLMESGDTLYGRYWGCHLQASGLHFETCYYQGLEHAIAKGLAHFDPGAQGAHKIARGFEPARTLSFHYVRDPELRRSIGAAIRRERELMEEQREMLWAQSPFRTP